MPDSNSNVIQMSDPLIEIGRRIDAAYERTQCGRQEWIEGSLELAAALLEGREWMGNVAFGAWLHENGHDHIERHQREALQNLGSNPTLMREVLKETDRGSYQLIWSEFRIRYPNIRETNSNANRIEPDNRSSASTGRGPWTRAIDARFIALIRRGTSREATAQALTREFNIPFTKGMCINAARRLGLTETRSSGGSGSPQRQSGGSGPSISISNRPSLTPMTREQVDPEWDRPDSEWVMRHGHVHVMTAVQKASQLFDTVADEMREYMRKSQEMFPIGRSRALMDDYWLKRLRSPKARSIARLTEALEYLRPRIAEAEAALARAVEAQRTVTAAE